MAKINQALIKPVRWAGLSNRVAVLFILSMLVFGGYAPGWGKLAGILSILTLWIIIWLVNRYDTFGFPLLWQYLKQQKYYPAHTPDSNYKYKYDKAGIR